jgi:hypothetical protein
MGFWFCLFVFAKMGKKGILYYSKYNGEQQWDETTKIK